MPRVAAWILAVGVAVAALASLWLASEMRYRNCLQDYEIAQENAFTHSYSGPNCSRLPF